MLGISDHSYGIGERKKQYLAEIKDLATRYLDKIKIYCGIEIATVPGLYSLYMCVELCRSVKGFPSRGSL